MADTVLNYIHANLALAAQTAASAATYRSHVFTTSLFGLTSQTHRLAAVVGTYPEDCLDPLTRTYHDQAKCVNDIPTSQTSHPPSVGRSSRNRGCLPLYFVRSASHSRDLPKVRKIPDPTVSLLQFEAH